MKERIKSTIALIAVFLCFCTGMTVRGQGKAGVEDNKSSITYPYIKATMLHRIDDGGVFRLFCYAPVGKKSVLHVRFTKSINESFFARVIPYTEVPGNEIQFTEQPLEEKIGCFTYQFKEKDFAPWANFFKRMLPKENTEWQYQQLEFPGPEEIRNRMFIIEIFVGNIATLNAATFHMTHLANQKDPEVESWKEKDIIDIVNGMEKGEISNVVWDWKMIHAQGYDEIITNTQFPNLAKTFRGLKFTYEAPSTPVKEESPSVVQQPQPPSFDAKIGYYKTWLAAAAVALFVGGLLLYKLIQKICSKFVPKPMKDVSHLPPVMNGQLPNRSFITAKAKKDDGEKRPSLIIMP